MTGFVLCVVLAAALGLAALGRRGHAGGSMRDYLTASGQFGSVLVFFLSVGEIYSIGGLMGFPGGVYAQGVSFAVWFVAYIILAMAVGYVLNPLIWHAARRTGALTVADLFHRHTGSRALGVFVALCGIGFLIPWGAMQFAGLDMVLGGLGIHVPRLVLMCVGAFLALACLMLSGVRAPAFVSVLKDVLLIGAILLVGVAILAHGVQVDAIARAWPHMPDNGPLMTPHQERFAMSTTLFQGVGLYMSPLAMAYLFTARSPGAIRRAQIPMPLYTIMFPSLALAALAARSHGWEVARPNVAFIVAAREVLPDWLVGVVAGAAALAALVVLAGTCLAIGPLLVRNVLPAMPEKRQKSYAQGAMVGYLALSILAANVLPGLIVTLNNLTYLGTTQFLPGVLVIVSGRQVSSLRMALGLGIGGALGIGLFLEQIDCWGINPGLIGLCVNGAIVASGVGAKTVTARVEELA